MIPSFDTHSLRLEYIPYFSQSPNRYFLGFLRDAETSDQNWNQTREYVRHLLFSFCWEQARYLTINNCFYLLGDVSSHCPLLFCDEATIIHGHTRTCLGVTVLQIPDDYTEISRGIKKINQYIIRALFALPFRARRELDAQLLVRLHEDRINPGVSTLEEICTRIVAHRLPATQIEHLPMLLQKSVARLQKSRKQCHGKALSQTEMVFLVFGQIESRS